MGNQGCCQAPKASKKVAQKPVQSVKRNQVKDFKEPEDYAAVTQATDQYTPRSNRDMIKKQPLKKKSQVSSASSRKIDEH